MTYIELKAKVLSGYMYKLDSGESKSGERNVVVQTGKGGALRLIDEFEKNGIPADLAATWIICYTDSGTYPLSQLTVTTNINHGNN